MQADIPLPPSLEPVALDQGTTSFDSIIPSWLWMVNSILRARRLIALTTLLSLSVPVAMLFQSREYTAISSFSPRSRRVQASLSGLAAQIGFNIPSAEAGESPAFYADLATARSILAQAVASEYRLQTDTGVATGDLIGLLRVRGNSPGMRRDAAIRKMAEATNASLAMKTGVITLRVTTPNRHLSAAINQRILDLLSLWNLQTRQNSPELSFEQQRLSRDVTMRQQIYSSLAQAYEQSRIEEARDTPVITVIVPPEIPIKPNSRGLLAAVVLSGMLGLSVGTIFALGWTGIVRSKDESPRAFEELRRQVSAVTARIRRFAHAGKASSRDSDLSG
jgi:uncharacterized protein involved in exopolysaccharide biosynthesis